jgi:Putative peptidoglycan binding domain
MSGLERASGASTPTSAFHTRRIRRALALALVLGGLASPALALAAASTGGAGSGGTGTLSPPIGPVAQKHSGGSPSAHPSHPRAPAHTHASYLVPAIAGARCVPRNNCSQKAHTVSAGGYLLLNGRGLKPGLEVAFPSSTRARISSRSPVAHIYRAKLGLEVRVPPSAHTGRIVARAGSLHSNAFGPIYVVRYALHPPTPTPPANSAPASATAFGGAGMWIWYLSHSAGGSIPAIAAQAHAAGISTLYVKSSDGSTNFWSQFTPQLVAAMHAAGLRVCAWQYVYGSYPVGEAELGARAVADGADCLVIDAEAEYESRYGAAQRYIETLRAKIGASYPLGLASFPYVDYHESFPYSVFLGPGGAQFNVPQMYWKAIGTSVGNVYVHTYEENLIYGRPICPLGQTYENPSSAQIIAFRSLAGPYGACGTSWWDWQETSSAGWAALAAPLVPEKVPQPELTSPLVKEGARGDQVLWLQEHLASAIPGQPTSGIFEATTAANLASFQTAHGIPASGETDPSTWAAALALPPVAVHWTGSGPRGG